jgi:hypothetical protein
VCLLWAAIAPETSFGVRIVGSRKPVGNGVKAGVHLQGDVPW